MIAYFIKHPTAANLLMLIIVLMGILGIFNMNRELFPDYSSNIISIQTIYRGATAEEVEENVTAIMEEQLDGLEGIDEITSTSRENSSSIKVKLVDGYTAEKMLDDIKKEIDSLDNLPTEIEKPTIFEVKQEEVILLLAITAEGLSETGLYKYGRQIREEVLALDGVSIVDIFGYSEPQVEILLSRDKLLSYGVSTTDIANAIKSQSIDVPSGSIETKEKEIKLRITDKKRLAQNFADIPVFSSINGANIRLGSIAEIKETFKDKWINEYTNGKRSITLQIKKTDIQDTIKLANTVNQFVLERQSTLPEEVSLKAWADWSKPLKDRLGMLIENGLLGFVLVFFTLWFFLNLRLSFWVAVGIPVSFMGALYILDFMDYSLNMITMFSLIMAIGIVVDDAIVLGENIFANFEQGKKPLEATLDGVNQVFAGVLSSMLTTIAIFMPLLAMEGQIGNLMKFMPVGVIAALLVSLTEGILILPSHLYHSLGNAKKEKHPMRKKINSWVEYVINDLYEPTLRWSLNNKAIPISIVISIFIFSVGLLASGRLSFTPFPKLDGDNIVVQVTMPPGTNLNKTKEVVKKIESYIPELNNHFKQPKDKELIVHYSTSYGVIFGSISSEPEIGSNVATVIVELLESDKRNVTCDQIFSYWRDKVGEIPGVDKLIYDQIQITPGGKAVDVKLKGKDLDLLKKASLELQEKIKVYPGVMNLTDDLRPGKQELQIKLKESAKSFGLTSFALADQIRNSFWGTKVQEFQKNNESVEVNLKYSDNDRDSLSNIDNFKVIAPNGSSLPFHEVATAEFSRGFSKIVRIDSKRTVSVTADIDSDKGNPSKIMQDLESTFISDFRKRYPKVEVSLEGQKKETQKTGSSVLKGFVIGLLMTYIVLSFIFKSYSEPIVVMLAVPFGFIGAVWGHILMGMNWTMPSMIGFISLSGIVVNDAIVLIEFIKIHGKENESINEKIIAAGKARFRAVSLTSATTVAGLFPMLLEKSMQAQFLVPMAISIAFGLLFATILVLIVIPTLYSLFYKLKIIKNN